MSIAGTKSSQGDDYQRIVALHWLIRLMGDEDEIAFIQAESTGLPGINEEIGVDDVVIVYRNGQRRHIQAKKNQPHNRSWSLTDESLSAELPKIRDQLESKDDTIVALYSRTPFGDLESLVEAAREYPDLIAFQRQAGEKLKTTLAALAGKWGRSDTDSFALLRRLEFGSHLSFDEWDRQNTIELARLVHHADLALPVLESYLNVHQSKLQAKTLTIRRDDVLQHLTNKGIGIAPVRGEEEILEQFRKASRIGRSWQRTIGGHRIPRTELEDLARLIQEGNGTILVVDRPGSGKTCLLLDLVDRIERDPRFGLLFIKGDRFARLHDEADLKNVGLPEDIVGLCGRLSERRQVVVIIDSLDVLSMNREHGALGIFLRLIDRLSPMPHVTVVAACRSFDLQYDPLLRDREWKHKVALADLDYEVVVAPLLKEWGVQEGQIDMQLKHLLRLPQNLRLFEAVANKAVCYSLRSAYELQEAYLQEAVVKGPGLGQPAMAALQELAGRLLSERTQLISPTAFRGGEPMRRALVSYGVLFEDPNGGLGFSHQTLLDNLAVYSALIRGEDLATFIKSYPPFPFLRPAVRTFVFHLRARSPQLFHRQVWAVFSDESIAYHFRRLVAESLAEIIPQNDDWPLLRRIFQQEPELFRRLFWRAGGEGWWRLLFDHWLPSLPSPGSDHEWHTLFVARFDQWMNTQSSEVVALWRRALSESWGDQSDLAFRITVQLHKFTHWGTEGIPELLDALVDVNKVHLDMLGKAISLYVDSTNRGDQLLWRYIVGDMNTGTASRSDTRERLHCQPHVFHTKGFLPNRLTQSELLLDNAISALEEWAKKENESLGVCRITSAFLHDSSWKYQHNQHDTPHHVDAISILLEGIEQALKYHARVNDTWWKEREPQLRSVREATILYFLALAYMENLDTNVDGMASLLTNAGLLRYGRIEHELGKLMQAGYHLLPPEIHDLNQQIVLSLYGNEDWAEEGMPLWAYKAIYDYLVWIPSIFRCPAGEDFCGRFRPQFGPYLPAPRLYSWGGWVGSPVPLEALIALNDNDVLRLLKYYNDYDRDSSHPADFNRGGRDQLEEVLAEAAAAKPVRWLAMLPLLESQELRPDYAISLLGGIANHLRYRFGRLQPRENWQPVKPLPDGKVLASSLLDLVEEQTSLWKDGRVVVRILEACSEVLQDYESAERLTPLLFRLLDHPDPAGEKQIIFSQNKQGITAQDLMHDSINSVRGIAASSAISLYNTLLEKDVEPPEASSSLLSRYARDPVPSVRAALLDHLPYLTSKRHTLGWQLFDDIFRDTQTHLWPLAERQMYCQYHEHFSEVAPYLERMILESPDEAGKSWGRIVTLALLSGHIAEGALFLQLESLNLTSAWIGMSQVLAANLDQHVDDGICVRGLRRILQTGNLDRQVYRSVEHAFSPKQHGRFLDADMANNFVSTIVADDQDINLHDFLDWIADLTWRDPINGLNVCERLAEVLIEMPSRFRLWHTEPLIAAVSNILREADETDDEDLIARAVRLQDQFLRMDIYGMDEYFKHAGQI